MEKRGCYWYRIKLTLNTDNDKIQIFGRVQNSFDEMWDGELAITAEDLFLREEKISAASLQTAAQSLWVEANTDMDSLRGVLTPRGNGTLPLPIWPLDSLSL